MSVTPAQNLYFRSRLLHGDLSSAAQHLVAPLDPRGAWIEPVKSSLVALGNLADLEGPMRSLYHDNPTLAQAMKALGPDLAFAKYLRNVFGGHLNEALIEKAFEWRAELRTVPHDRTPGGTIILNLFVLETAINTYVAADGSRGMFPSETDLVYPPDNERFCTWLTATVASARRICDDLGAITHSLIPPHGEGPQMLDAFKTAGLTDFVRIRKGRQA